MRFFYEGQYDVYTPVHFLGCLVITLAWFIWIGNLAIAMGIALAAGLWWEIAFDYCYARFLRKHLNSDRQEKWDRWFDPAGASLHDILTDISGIMTASVIVLIKIVIQLILRL